MKGSIIILFLMVHLITINAQTNFSSFSIEEGQVLEVEKEGVGHAELFGPIDNKYYELRVQSAQPLESRYFENHSGQNNNSSQFNSMFFPDELFNKRQAFAGSAIRKNISINCLSEKFGLEKSLNIDLKGESKYAAFEFCIESKGRLYFFIA